MDKALYQDKAIAEQFADLHPALTAQGAVVESNRCLNCFDAPCTSACPTHIDVPRFIKKIATGNLRGSAESILAANVLAVSCARVCPVEVLCEGSCVLHRYNDKPIQIGNLQRFAMETFYNSGAKIPLRARPEQKLRVALIGAGPASLACAAELRQLGIQATIIDKRPLAGGLNTYGVAEYKLRAADSLAEIEHIRQLGVEFRIGEVSGRDALERLEASFDAVFLGIGLGAMHRLSIPGADHPAVVDALQFIAAYKTAKPLPPGYGVVVIGAGNTAIDAAVAAVRLGAENVRILYRRSRENISAFDFEYEHAKNEGVHFVWNTLPLSFRPATGAGPHILDCVRAQLGANGLLLPDPSSQFRISCDMVIPAIGQSPLLAFLGELRGIQIDRGRIVINRTTGQTAHPKYFAGGDCVNGGREVVDAVADGKRAAIGIAAALMPQEADPG